MKQIVLISLFCITIVSVQSKNKENELLLSPLPIKIESPTLSPNGKIIALYIIADYVKDIYIYDLVKDSLFRTTLTGNIGGDLMYKSGLCWINNDSLLFLSKHNGTSQQYILDLGTLSISSNGQTESDEYLIDYSVVNKESYYMSSVNRNEPAVFRRKLGNESKAKKVTKQDNTIYMYPLVSPNGNYLFYNEMPSIRPLFYSLSENKIIKTTLPKNNVRLLSWSPDSKKFTYKYSIFEDGTPIPSIYIYDIESHKSEKVQYLQYELYNSVWSNDISHICFSKEGGAFIYNTQSKKITEIEAHGIPQFWLNDNKNVVFRDNETLYIYNLENNTKKVILSFEQSTQSKAKIYSDQEYLR